MIKPFHKADAEAFDLEAATTTYSYLAVDKYSNAATCSGTVEQTDVRALNSCISIGEPDGPASMFAVCNGKRSNS